MLIQIKDGKPVNHPVLESNFRMLFPTVSFPEVLTPSVVEPFGFGLYKATDEPEVDRYFKSISGEPVKGEDDVWRQTWEVVAMNPEECEEADKSKAIEARGQRDMFLFTSDWTQLPDAPVDSAAWATYRQELRDLTKQAGFPWDVQWPTKPS